MAKFHGKVGYGKSVDVGHGVYETQITEKTYFGDVIRNARRLEGGDKVNSDIAPDNSISIVADAYANQHFFAIKYVEWAGSRWIVSSVETQRPRLILRLGGVYNGPTA